MNAQITSKERYIFLIVSFSLWTSHFLYVPILSPYMEFLGSPFSYIGIVLGSYGLMQLLCRLPIGMSSDLLKRRKPFIIAGMLISALSTLIFALTNSLGWILLARSLAGVAASSWVAFTVLYSTYFEGHEVHRAMGSISFVVVVAQLVGMSLSGVIVDQLGWKAPFWIGFIVSMIGVGLSLIIFESKEALDRELIQIKELTLVIKDPVLMKISILSILAHSIIFTTMFGFIPSYAINIGLETSDISLLVFSFMIPHAVATLFIGKYIVPYLGNWNSLKIAFLFTSLFTAIIPTIHSKIGLAIVQGFNGFSLGLLFPLLLGMAIESISFEKRATAMGVYQALYAIGIFGGPFVAGIFNSWVGIEAGFYFTSLLGFLAVILVIFWNKTETISSIEIIQTKERNIK